MTSYRIALAPGLAPVLVADRFSVLAFLFGPLWLAAYAAFLPALILFALQIASVRLLPPGDAGLTELALSVSAGLFGQDLRLRSLRRRGFTPGGIVLGRTREAALCRLLDTMPELRDSLPTLRDTPPTLRAA